VSSRWSAVHDVELSRRVVLHGGLGALGAVGIAGLAAVAGCASGSPAGRAPSANPSSAGTTSPPLTGAASIASVVAGMREFAQRLHGTNADVSANWTASPLSISIACGMLRAGSRGATARGLDHALGYPPSNDPRGSPHAALHTLMTELLATAVPITRTPSSPPVGSGPTMPAAPVVGIANALFPDRRFLAEIKPDYTAILRGEYGASPIEVSFGDPSAPDVINSWVKKQTRGRIAKLFDQLDPSDVLVLANAVYLKAGWAYPFSPAATVAGPFTTASGPKVSASFMTQILEGVAYRSTSAGTRVDIPYGAPNGVSGWTMRVVLPPAGATPRAGLDVACSEAVAVDAGRPTLVKLTLPKWDTKTAIDLKSALAQLGADDLADLAGIADGVFVSQAVHRANITVDENGTEAAAATGIGVATSASASPPVPVRLDRPFAWAIVHEPTGTPVFTGHVVDPTR
jgi:serpin B